jgi:hypothetical protein
LNVYPDHNFLIYCVKNPTWRKAVTEAHKVGRITVVLSAWHFYEYGNASGYADTESLIEFAEELQPKWILERADLQHREFIVIWNYFWSGGPPDFNPICTLAEQAAALNRVPVERMSRYSIRDYVKHWSTPGALDEIQAVMKAQTEVARQNMSRYVADRNRFGVLPLTECAYVAIQFARLHEVQPWRVWALAQEIFREGPLSVQIQCFVYWRCTEYLKAYMTEVALTLELYPTGAALSMNRQIDRQHAIMALPYCDVLVTDDKDLRNRIARVKPKLRFKTAEVMRGQDFIDSL